MTSTSAPSLTAISERLARHDPPHARAARLRHMYACASLRAARSVGDELAVAVLTRSVDDAARELADCLRTLLG